MVHDYFFATSYNVSSKITIIALQLLVGKISSTICLLQIFHLLYVLFQHLLSLLDYCIAVAIRA
jgi:hypothetical protein